MDTYATRYLRNSQIYAPSNTAFSITQTCNSLVPGPLRPLLTFAT